MNTQKNPIRVLLVDDHKSFSEGLSMLINVNKQAMEVVGMAQNRKEACSLLDKTQPDIVLLDVDLGDDNGIEILPEITKKTNAKFIILTGVQDPTVHEKAVLNGARGVLLKGDPARVILKAIEKVYLGEIWLNNETLNKVLNQLTRQKNSGGDDDSNGQEEANPEKEKIASLTRREREIIKALVKNDSSTNKEIAENLFISDSTLKNHLTTVYDKLQIKNRIELLKYAIKNDLDKD